MHFSRFVFHSVSFGWQTTLFKQMLVCLSCAKLLIANRIGVRSCLVFFGHSYICPFFMSTLRAREVMVSVLTDYKNKLFKFRPIL